MKISWRKVLPLKFTGGLLALAAGLTVGREGPSIQMGASLGQAVGDLLRRPAEERIELLTAGAAAGLTAAFHAPLSGVVFALEELSQGFNKAVLLPAAVAALAADAVQSWILGTAPVLNFGLFPHLGPHELLLLIPLGVLLALLAYCFTEGISFVKRLYQMLPCPLALKIALAFSLSTLAVLFKPILFGAGGELIALPLTEGELSLSYLAFLLCSKFLLLLIAFSSGMPGGIFFPMLVLGSLCGQLWALFLVHMTWLSPDLILAYGILGMAASFVAIVRSPLTGMLLILELTGSFRMLLPLLLVALVAYLAAEEMGVEPVYERLLRHQLDPQSLRWGYRRPLDAET